MENDNEEDEDQKGNLSPIIFQRSEEDENEQN